MSERLMKTVILLVLLLTMAGCDAPTPSKTHLAATIEGQRVGLEIEATRQYLNAQATREAVAVEATATAVAVASRSEELRQARIRDLETVKAWGLVATGVILALAIGITGLRFASVYLNRARLLQLRADRGEAVLLIGKERFALPMRHFASYADLTHGEERAPALVPPERQERTTERQQATNLLQARQAGEIARARSSGGERHTVWLTPTESSGTIHTPRAQEPGLLGVTEAPQLEGATKAGLLPQPLADAIEARWREVEDD